MVVATINSASLSVNGGAAPTATAIYDIYFGLQELRAGRVIVIPSRRESDLLTRGAVVRGDVSIDVAVQYKYGTAGPTANELDPWLGLSESIPALFLGKTFSVTFGSGDTQTIGCLKAEYPFVYFEPHIREMRTFTSVSRMTFTTIRS